MEILSPAIKNVPQQCTDDHQPVELLDHTEIDGVENAIYECLDPEIVDSMLMESVNVKHWADAVEGRALLGSEKEHVARRRNAVEIIDGKDRPTHHQFIPSFQPKRSSLVAEYHPPPPCLLFAVLVHEGLTQSVPRSWRIKMDSGQVVPKFSNVRLVGPGCAVLHYADPLSGVSPPLRFRRPLPDPHSPRTTGPIGEWQRKGRALCIGIM
eukprot:7525301-Pyramimonas_sp.AAC.1